MTLEPVMVALPDVALTLACTLLTMALPVNAAEPACALITLLELLAW